MPGFFQTSPHVPFPFAEYTLYPFAEINRSHEHLCYILSPMSSPSKLPNLGVIWGLDSHSVSV